MTEKKKESGEISRREFLKDAGLVVGGAAVGSTMLLAACAGEETTVTVGVEGIPLSKGYLLFDPKKCGGCITCMLACSLVHEGESNPSLSGIQVADDSFGCYPTDIEMSLCLQCEEPLCYLACPLKDEALCIDGETGVRYINEDKCLGETCQLCIAACRYLPSRIAFNPDKNTAVKCDLCKDTPYWDSQGKQACVEVCSANCLKFTTEKPIGYAGYIVNLRGEGWAKWGLPTD